MKKTANTPQVAPEDSLYLRRVGAPIRGQYPYLYTDAQGKTTGVVFVTDRTIAKAKVWFSTNRDRKFYR